MRQYFSSIAALFAIPWFVSTHGNEQTLSFVTSSPFAMKLTPTELEMDIAATSKLELNIKTSLLLSASVTTNFESVFDIDVVLQAVARTSTELSTSIQFEIHSTFIKVDLDDSSPPTQFALDSLIARTFSQPSTKSNFITNLGLSEEPVLTGVQDIGIQLVEADETEGTVENEESTSLSSLDIILITASSLIFCGILYVIYQHHQDRAELEAEQIRTQSSWNRTKSARALAQVASATAADEEGVGKDCMSSNIEYFSEATEEEVSVARHSKSDSIESTGKDHSLISQAKQAAAVYDSEDTRSPPISPCLSMSTSPVSSGLTSPTPNSPMPPSPMSSDSSSQSPNSPMPSSPINITRSTSYLLGAPAPNYPTGDCSASSSSSELSPLTARLLRLPMMNTLTEYNRSPLKSSASAPGILMESRSLPSIREHPKMDSKSVKSARIAAEKRGGELFVDAVLTPSSSNITDLAVASEHSRLTIGQHFKTDWMVSKRKAMQDHDDSSEEDIFQIDVEAHNSVEDTRSRMSGLSAVSEWMKSIQVVGSTSDTKTSEMTNSSAEHSSIEPQSLRLKESNSAECSLEHSMAASLVEV